MTTAQIPWMGSMVTVELLPIRAATASHPAMLMYAESAYNFARMDAAAKAAGINLTVNTAFRDHAYQQQLWDAYQAALARGESPSVVARPGTSDHERGFSVDLETGVPASLRSASKEAKAASSSTYRWLHQNAASYGFVNDVNSEPWHWTNKPTSLKIWDAAAGGGGAAVGVLVLLGLGMLLLGKS